VQYQLLGLFEQAIVGARVFEQAVQPMPHIHIAIAQNRDLTFEQLHRAAGRMCDFDIGQQIGTFRKEIGMKTQISSDLFGS